MDDAWHRVFIALTPDAATRAALAALPAGGGRRVAAEQLHLTLAFLGTVEAGKGAALAARLASLAAPLPPIPFEQVAHWPSAARPRLVVASFLPSPAVVELEARVRTLLADEGLSVDDHRPFRPHVTLARLPRQTARTNRHAGAPERSAEAGASVFGPSDCAAMSAAPRFDTLVLFSSTLERRGARYRALAAVPLPEA